MLAYKCQWYGSRLVVANRYFPSVVDKIPLHIREWPCPACGTHHDRDVNAEKNLLILAS